MFPSGGHIISCIASRLHMLPKSEPVTGPQTEPEIHSSFDFRLVAAILLLAAATALTWMTIEGLSARRQLRTDLAEISHVRYDLLNADRWVSQLVPILEAQIDALDLTKANLADLRPTVRNALNALLDDVKNKMTAKTPGTPPAGGGGFLAAGNPMIVNMIVGALRPHVPEYADIVLAQLAKPETKAAVKKYIKGVLTEGAKNTFGNVDMTLHSSILRQYGCADAAACKQELGNRIREADTRISYEYLSVLGASALAFLLLLTARPILRVASAVVLLLFCTVLLVGGVLTPMLEVEARISHVSMTFLGQPMTFTDQVLYFQSKSVLEVFRALVTTGRPDMWVVGVLVLMFSIVFPILKLIASVVYLRQPALVRENRVARFFALESSKWSMADVMALAIFMSFVAFNGLIPHAMSGLQDAGAALTIPTDASKILPGYHLFIAFCLASLFLSRKLARGIRQP
jgi:Paraquat-inducible protein A